MAYTLTQQEFSGLKSRLTRAKKKGPEAVVAAVEHAVKVFDEKGWPDNWPTWGVALRDAAFTLRRAGKNAEADQADALGDRF